LEFKFLFYTSLQIYCSVWQMNVNHDFVPIRITATFREVGHSQTSLLRSLSVWHWMTISFLLNIGFPCSWIIKRCSCLDFRFCFLFFIYLSPTNHFSFKLLMLSSVHLFLALNHFMNVFSALRPWNFKNWNVLTKNWKSFPKKRIKG
jgi:hypothetical protein